MNRCAHVIWRGQKKGQQCERQTTNQFCYKHRNSIAATGKKEKADQELAADPVFGTDHAPAAPKVSQVKSSVYLVTVNLNQALDKISGEEKQKFKDFIEYIFDKDTLFSDYLLDSNGHSPQEVVESIDIEYHFEVGGSLGRIHAHAYINLQHRGHFTMNIADIRALGRKVFGGNIHVNVQVTSDPTLGLKNYTRKKEMAAGRIEKS